jgi:hypothetical protein
MVAELPSSPISVATLPTAVKFVLLASVRKVFERYTFVTASWSDVGLATFLILVEPAS